MRLTTFVLLLSLLSSCATAKGRFLVGAGLGGAAGSGAGVYFSPNQESKGMNALVFGLIGALTGGIIGLLAFDDGRLPASKTSLRAKEEAEAIQTNSRIYTVPTGSALPQFVKERLEPTLVEELIEPDTVSEDGSLHEPHKVYRIKRQTELYSRGTRTPSSGASK